MNDVIPGILEKEFSGIEEKLEIIRPFSKKVHIDVLDGKFCDEISFLDPKAFIKYRNEFFMEAHLMVDDPASYIKPFAKAGFKRFLGHIEKMKDLDGFIAEGQIFGEVGIGIDVDTQPDSLKIPFDELDCVLLMGVKAGKSGQTFLPQTLERIRSVRQLTQIPIEIDGGINEQTIVDCKQEGAERFVATSFIFESKDPIESFEKLVGLA